MSSPTVDATAGAHPDAAARARAATDFATNLGVTAGAGAGKTSLLIERMLEALLVRGIPLERLVATTFTEKAAAEMRQRLLAGLAAVAEERGDDRGEPSGRVLARARAATGPDRATLRARAAAALTAPPRIGTLHSFALGLLQRHPLEADVPADVAMDLGDGFTRHVRGALPDLVEGALASQGPHGAAARALAELEVDDLAALVERLAWLPEQAAASGIEVVAPLVGRLGEELAAARAQLPERRGRAGRLYEQWDALLAAIAWVKAHPPTRSERFALPPALAAALPAPSAWSKAQVDAPGVDLAAVRVKLVLAGRRLVRLAALDEPRIAALLAVARPWAATLRTSFLATGRISADGALAAAARLLAEHPAVRRDEAARLDHLLVDEFQDTDALQRDLVFLLCERADRPPAARAADVELAPGRLFLVGDPKQSIYRFRGADLDVWQETLERLTAQGGATLVLSTSFRSPPELVAPQNRFFARWHDPANDAEPPWHPLHAARPSDPSAGVEWLDVVRGDEAADADARAEAEGRAIAAEIARWLGEKVAPDAPPRRRRDCVILLRRLSRLHCFAGPLRERGLPFTVSGGRTFARRTEVGELASLLLAAADPTDEQAALGALRGGLGALTDRELLSAKQAAGSLCWPRLLVAGAAVPAAALELARRLQSLQADLDRLPLPAALARFLEASPLLLTAAFARDGEQRIANLRKLAERVEARALEHGLPLAEAVREVLGLDESVEGESERSLADDELDAVRILTVHAAKGLEFDQVFLPELTARPHEPGAPPLAVGLHSQHDGVHLAVAVQPRAAPASANAPQLLREQRDLAHRDAEAKRLLYVAMTRARRRLVLVTAAGGNRRGSFAEALALHLGDTVVPRSVTMPERSSAPLGTPALDPATVATAAGAFVRAVAAAAAPRPRFARPSGPAAAPAHAPVAAPASDRTYAQALGELLHLALAERGPQQPPAAAAIERALLAVAADWPNARRVTLAAEARELLAGAPARRLFDGLRDVRTVALELPLTLWRDGCAWRGAADLVFFDGGTLVIGDWKSDRLDEDAALADRHRAQLHLYRDALAAAWQVAPPRTELLLLRSGRRLSV